MWWGRVGLDSVEKGKTTLETTSGYVEGCFKGQSPHVGGDIGFVRPGLNWTTMPGQLGAGWWDLTASHPKIASIFDAALVQCTNESLIKIIDYYVYHQA